MRGLQGYNTVRASRSLHVKDLFQISKKKSGCIVQKIKFTSNSQTPLLLVGSFQHLFSGRILLCFVELFLVMNRAEILLV